MYIAGPISGHDPEIVKHRFKIAALELKILDIDPINPTDMSGWGLSWEAYMIIAEAILLRSGEIDGILMLEGWEDSQGAKIEHTWAELNKIPIYYEKDGILEATTLKERAERPYDAMGDDQGRGGSAETKIEDPGDTWYRENFVEKYDDRPEVYHKIEVEGSAVVKAIKRGNGIPGEVKK